MHVYFVFQTMYLVQVYWNKFCSISSQNIKKTPLSLRYTFNVSGIVHKSTTTLV